ncbi:hypothetical protein FH972_012985 [Carpinus fangiana]|uniref:Uncharacterized protein n=1 Tax=Carpinus fangiana TaxID=176857 RepID=A0A5N6R8I8_9ROSI|nr:hypothetical protein FH972_012985 [Carpinus fangiana]
MHVSVIGALHWVPHIEHSDYIVSMEVDKEKFHTIPLPKIGRTHDRIVETGGFLSFVAYGEVNQIDIWILKGLGESWTKQHSIKMGCVLDMVPLLSLRIQGVMIFKRDEDGSFSAHAFQLQVMRKIEMCHCQVRFYLMSIALFLGVRRVARTCVIDLFLHLVQN